MRDFSMGQATAPMARTMPYIGLTDAFSAEGIIASVEATCLYWEVGRGVGAPVPSPRNAVDRRADAGSAVEPPDRGCIRYICRTHTKGRPAGGWSGADRGLGTTK